MNRLHANPLNLLSDRLSFSPLIEMGVSFSLGQIGGFLDLTGKQRGIYFLLLNIDGEIINRKFYLE